MQVITDLTSPPWPGTRSVVSIGMYDGVHVGHRTVIAQTRERAARTGARSVVVTFDRHPMSVVRPEQAPRLLTTLEHKLELLSSTGVDAVVVVSFDEHQSHETAVEFVERVLVHGLAAESVIVGSDFHFGHMRQGNVTLLREMGERRGFTADPVRLVPRADGVDEPVSSTAVRRALAGGEIDTANRMLGRPHEVRGTVVDGDKRGRTIGFPTANVAVPPGMCVPADGVYAAVHVRPDGSEHPCAVNIGRRPTFYRDAQHSLIESHLLDFDGDIYGETASVRFLAFLRSEKAFGGVDELRAQLVVDNENARRALLARGSG
ncbi:MAG: bifunctional riboflavin kinase/FAD synthetase [Ilumatobacteraceae bacterium]